MLFPILMFPIILAPGPIQTPFSIVGDELSLPMFFSIVVIG